MDIEFLLNGETVTVPSITGTETLLDTLRARPGCVGTKEGCNEGDCGACSVIVTAAGEAPKAMNACILFLPQLHGKAVRTVEGLAAQDGTLHPMQEAMITHHGSQCGFCTPGFVTTMAAAHANGETDADQVLAGNLCRCTGYEPIARAFADGIKAPVPPHMQDAPTGAKPPKNPNIFCPYNADALAAWYAANPTATLIGGGTDVGLWVTKGLRDLGLVAFLDHADDLKRVEEKEDHWQFGTAVSMTTVLNTIRGAYPSLAAMLERYGSPQVRNAATLGGNIANGSPIGDSPPPLIALGARLGLRQGHARREIALEDFFIDYGKQDRSAGEFVEYVRIPKHKNAMRVYKLSKRFDQDISAVCGAFWVDDIEDSIITQARIAFGGMAGTPKRAKAVEAALMGKPWNEATIRMAMTHMKDDFTPLSDMRASAEYRLQSAENMLLRYYYDLNGQTVDVRQVTL